jgi:hypothetical protein
MTSPVVASHTRIVRSKEPDAMRFPSGENATEYTPKVCPCKTSCVVGCDIEDEADIDIVNTRDYNEDYVGGEIEDARRLRPWMKNASAWRHAHAVSGADDGLDVLGSSVRVEGPEKVQRLAVWLSGGLRRRRNKRRKAYYILHMII